MNWFRIRSYSVMADVVDPVLHGQELFGLLVGDVDAKVFFDSHRDLDQIARVGAEAAQATVRAVDGMEICARRDFLRTAAEVFNQDGGEFAGDVSGVRLAGDVGGGVHGG